MGEPGKVGREWAQRCWLARRSTSPDICFSWVGFCPPAAPPPPQSISSEPDLRSQGCEVPSAYDTLFFHGQFSSVQFSLSFMSDSLRSHESQHTRPPCPSPTPGVYSNSCPSSRWCRPAISSSVVPFSSCPQSLPASGSFPMSQLFAWGGQSHLKTGAEEETIEGREAQKSLRNPFVPGIPPLELRVRAPFGGYVLWDPWICGEGCTSDLLRPSEWCLPFVTSYADFWEEFVNNYNQEVKWKPLWWAGKGELRPVGPAEIMIAKNLILAGWIQFLFKQKCVCNG